MNFRDLDRRDEALREPLGLFSEGPGAVLPAGAPVLSAGTGSPAVQVPQAHPGQRGDVLEEDGGESRPHHDLQSHRGEMPQGRLSLCQRRGCACTGWALPSAGSGETPHQLRHQPRGRQLEIPAEGQRWQQLLLSHAGAAPSPTGKVFVGASATAERSYFPHPSHSRVTSPRHSSPQNTHRRTPPASKRTPAAALPGGVCLSGCIRPSLAAA